MNKQCITDETSNDELKAKLGGKLRNKAEGEDLRGPTYILF